MARPRTDPETRFWMKVDKRGPEECWPWVGAGQPEEYGKFYQPTGRSPGRSVHAHRVAWELANGELVGERWVLHTCDNRSCCNPAHLYAGTAADNTRDMIERGRANYVRGERHGMSKLTDVQRDEIRSSPEATSVLASRYGVTGWTVRKIKRGG